MDLLQHIVDWANTESAIQALLLQGSRATGSFDKWSDFDLALFCSDSALFTSNDRWIAKIGPHWVCVKEKVALQQRFYPSRLVIFEGGAKADFTFYSLDVLEQPRECGYQILIDKTHSLKQTPCSPSTAAPPQESEFVRVVEEYWFEAYHVAISLLRKDLWSVKFRSNAMHGLLLSMIEWDYESEHNWTRKALHHGKNMSSWVDANTWKSLQGVFAHFDAEESWSALFHTMELFRRIAKKVAARLSYNYPASVDQHISRFISAHPL